MAGALLCTEQVLPDSLQDPVWRKSSLLPLGGCRSLLAGAPKGHAPPARLGLEPLPLRFSRPVAPRLADHSTSLPCTWNMIQSTWQRVTVEGGEMLIAWRAGHCGISCLDAGGMIDWRVAMIQEGSGTYIVGTSVHMAGSSRRAVQRRYPVAFRSGR